jgi:hypothetical protein
MRPFRPARSCSRCFGVMIVAVAFIWQQPFSTLLAQSAIPQADKVPRLDVIVLAGDGGVNIIKAKKAVMPVVEVRDKERRTVPGLAVTFVAPTSGPHVTFADGNSTYSTVTDSNGRATVSAMTPVGQGEFKINVSATYQGQTATAVVSQTNYLTATAANATAGGTGTPGATTSGATTSASHGISKTLIGVIIAGVAAGAGAAVALGKGGKGSSTSPPPPTSTGTIGGTGSSTIGPPH